jgi:hypothetical protein
LFNQRVANIAVLRIGLAVLGKEFNIVRLQTVMIAETTEEFSAG